MKPRYDKQNLNNRHLDTSQGTGSVVSCHSLMILFIQFPVDDSADEDVAEDADDEDDGLEERPHHRVVEGVVLGVFAPDMALSR